MIDSINVCSILPSETVIPRSSCDTTYWNRYKIAILIMMLAIHSVSILIGVARNFRIFLITRYINRNIAPSISNRGVADRARGSIVNPHWGIYKAAITNTNVLIMIERTNHPSIVRTCRDNINVNRKTVYCVRILIEIFLTVAREKYLLFCCSVTCESWGYKYQYKCDPENWHAIIVQ